MTATKTFLALVLAPLGAMLVAGASFAQDADHGKAVFKACAACHTAEHTNRIGPGLGGVVGRQAGTAPSFNYSAAMKAANRVWDAASLNEFLEAPQKAVPGNRMPFPGLKNEADRRDVIAYLETLK